MTEAVAILAALGTFVATLVASFRTLRADKATQAEKEEAALLAGYKALAEELRGDIARLRSEFEADRQRWREERDMLREEVRACRRRINELEHQTS